MATVTKFELGPQVTVRGEPQADLPTVPNTTARAATMAGRMALSLTAATTESMVSRARFDRSSVKL